MNDLYNDVISRFRDADRHMEDITFRKYRIVDIGTILDYEDGRARVRSYEGLYGDCLEYENVEVLFIGNTGGGFDKVVPGSLCLLFRPVSTVSDTRTNKVIANGDPYNSIGMKAIPVTNAFNADVHAGFNTTGNFEVTTAKGLTTSFCLDQINIIASGKMLVTVLESGKIISASADGRRVVVTDTDGTYTVRYLNSEGSYVARLTTTVDGKATYARYEDDEWKDMYTLTTEDVSLLIETDDGKAEVSRSQGEAHITIEDDNSAGSAVLKPDGAELTIGDDTKISVADKSAELTIGNNTKVSVGDQAITLQTASNIKVVMGSSDVTINGHLKVT